MSLKVLEQYKTLEELKEYAEAQYKTILVLSKAKEKLEEERNHLKQLLETSVPLIKSEIQDINESDVEYICTVEISKLKNITAQRELTYEEAKRLEIYFKTLNQINSRNKDAEREVKDLTPDQLLKLVEVNDNAD